MQQQLTIELSANAPRAARHSLDQHSGRVEESPLNDVRLLSSEIVTNAVQHFGRPHGDPITIDTVVESGVLRVEVESTRATASPHSDQAPQRHPQGSRSGSRST